MKKIQTPPRKDYISWNSYFMISAMIPAFRSKDPNTQVGACIIKENRIIATGYNGLTFGTKDEDIDWSKEGELEDTKYPYVCHAEANAILNCKSELKGSTLYVTLFPCYECAKLIAQMRIKKVVYYEDKYNGTKENLIAKKILKNAGVETELYQKTGEEITIQF